MPSTPRASTAEPDAGGTPAAGPSGPWVPFPIGDDVNGLYSEVLSSDRFTLHYAPNTLPAQDPAAVAALVAAGLRHIEERTGARMEGHFDVYVAGDLFAAPNQALRGHSFSASRRYFLLYDGSGDGPDQQYITTHELTHLFAWNVFGRPVSAMLSEGLAVYMGTSQIEGQSKQIPLATYCALLQRAGALPRVSGNLSFGGHIRDLPNYYAAGCFVKHLAEAYGPSKIAQLYPSGDYQSIYGRSLARLEQAWLEEVSKAPVPASIDPAALTEAGERLGSAYEGFFLSFRGTSSQRKAYWELDAARLALLEGRLSDVDVRLAAAQAHLAE